MNKKAQINFNIGIVSLLVVALIFIAFFYFSSSFRYIAIGLGLGIMSFVVLLKSNIKSQTKTFLFIGLLGIGLVFILGSGVLESTFSVDSVNVGSDGKVYWLVTAVADSINEGYTFNYNPNTYTKSDGTKIDPQDSLRLSFSKQASYCKYTLQPESYKDVNYKVLSNPDRVANIYIQDSNSGDNIIIDGTSVQTKTLNGLTIKTQGIIAGKTDCPNYENVIVSDNGRLLEKDDYKSAIDGCVCPWYNPICQISSALNCKNSLEQVSENSQFISAFNQMPTVSTNEIRGNIDIGNAIFTITANQDYFNSVVINPPKDVKPNIDSINIPSEIKVGDTSSVSVIISNRETSEGTISVKATSNDLSISNSIQNKILKDKKTVNFLVTANNNDGSSSIKIEACATNQFGTSTCDTETKAFKIIKEQPKEFCGDGICQVSESFTTCSQDCKQEDDNKTEDLTCKWYQESYTKTEKDYGALYWRAYTPFVDPIETEITGCKTASWINLVVIVVLVGSLGAYAIYVSKPKRKRK